MRHELHARCYVNANGNLTFGAPSTDFTESAAEFLSGPPRIAGLWDDLNSTAGGSVYFTQTANTFTVTWDSVPEYFSTGANTFTITLRKGSNHIDIDYGDLTAIDGLAGVSCGGAVTSGFEAPTRPLGAAPRAASTCTTSRRSTRCSPDQRPRRSTVRFNGTTDYEDNWAEPNDTLGHARNISLPFDSIPVTRFTEIEPTGGDVDFYRFSAQAGTTLVAEIVSGSLDSVIVVADATGLVLAADDDGGNGLLSRIVLPIPADGDYYLGVTTYPDLDFTGAGSSGGRYVMSVDTIDGILLGLGDDTSQEVTLPFSFPFQGSSYSSVFVNSNGNLTFGSGDTDFSESVGELLGDQPRIAAAVGRPVAEPGAAWSPSSRTPARGRSPSTACRSSSPRRPTPSR